MKYIKPGTALDYFLRKEQPEPCLICCPTTSEARSQRLELRLTDDERHAAATAVGETLSDFFRHAASARAQDIFADQQLIALNDKEAARFLDALDAVDQDTVMRLRELRERA